MPNKKKNRKASAKVPKKEAKNEEQKFEERKIKYKAIKSSIQDGTFSKFEDIFSIIPPTNVGKDISVNFEGFKNRRAFPGNFTISELMRLADLIGIHVNEIIKLILNEIQYKYR